MTDEEIRDQLAATFDHEPTEVHTSKGPTGQVCCGHCFVNWPCPAVRKIGRVMVPMVRAIAAEERDKARAPFLALANHLAYRYPSYDHRDKAEASREAADHIRRVVALDGGQ